MQSIINHAAPNVVPGTNFNTHRFRELYAWMSALSADAARSAMQAHAFGLVAAFDGKRSFLLEKTGDLLALRRCAGITPAGRVVGIFEGLTPIIETSLEKSQLDPKEQYHVLVAVDSMERLAFGPQAGDQPDRPAFTMPANRLHIQSIGQTAGAFADTFPVGLLVHQNGNWELADYLPPCAHLCAHELLAAKYREYRNTMKTMLTALPSIIRQTDSFRDKSMIELREFTMQCGSYLAARQPDMASLAATSRPFDLLEMWMGFASLTSFLLDCLTDRPGFYNLLYANTRSVNGVMFTTERLDKAVFQLAEMTYDHHDIRQTIQVIDCFLETIVPVFKAMGNGALQPIHSGYEQVRQAPVNSPPTSFSTW